MKRLILIRHCETDYTLQKKYCGHKNISLNAKGIEQANSLLAKLINIKVDSVYSSDLVRAFQTAKIIFSDKIIHKRKALREIDFGQFCSLTFKEANRLYPDAYKTLIKNPQNAKIPKGESMHDFAKRVGRCFDRICKQNPEKTVALVSHGGPIRIILLKIARQGLDKFWDIQQDLAAINIIEFYNGIPKIIKINNTSHLR